MSRKKKVARNVTQVVESVTLLLFLSVWAFSPKISAGLVGSSETSSLTRSGFPGSFLRVENSAKIIPKNLYLYAECSFCN